MNKEKEVIVNSYGQSIIGVEVVTELFNKKDSKRLFLEDLVFLIQQSKPLITDVDAVIKNSGLKETCTPCVMLRKDVKEYNLRNIINLPDYELVNVFILFLELFKVAYQRRFLLERNNPNKWWYWDLNRKENVDKIFSEHDDTVAKETTD
ncbi:DUF5958 family protein [Myroides profundi]|uniref:Uncharacterized protein n=1 Tax=Myroides profundi TaxID=480520 RepID=A0AAJ5BC83_MYRPR|nr:DUF5958 family protein [Myroides profundi]AJH13611.1 hypothetical protein MPR_0399 [Myroides profundi]SEP92021.1 hypothetical protein SAMN04488089_10192 [Myroides profundi]